MLTFYKKAPSYNSTVLIPDSKLLSQPSEGSNQRVGFVVTTIQKQIN